MIHHAYVLPEDAQAGVRARVAETARIRADFCPRPYLKDFLSYNLHGCLPAAYCLIDFEGPGLMREGETGDLWTRMQAHRPLMFSGALWFSGPNIDKDMAVALQYLFAEAFAKKGCRAPGPMPQYPDVHWPTVNGLFEPICALAHALGFKILPGPDEPRPLYWPRDIEPPHEAENVWEYAGPLNAVAAQVDGDIYLLRHSHIRARAVASARQLHRDMRDFLLARELLVPSVPGALMTLRDLRFPSLDAAAKFVRGDSGGSRREWVLRQRVLEL